MDPAKAANDEEEEAHPVPSKVAPTPSLYAGEWLQLIQQSSLAAAESSLPTLRLGKSLCNAGSQSSYTCH